MKQAKGCFVPGMVFWIFLSVSSYAQEIYIYPGEVYISVGASFTADVMVRDVTGLSAFEFCISFDKDTLEAIDVVKGSLWSKPEFLWHAGEIDNASGLIGFTSGTASSDSGPIEVNMGANGGLLATITFQAKASRPSVVRLTDAFMCQADGQQINVSVTNAQIIDTASPPVAYVDILMSVKPFKAWWEVTATVSIRNKDADGLPVGGAEVSAHWDGVHSESVSRETKKDGDISFKTGWIRTEGTVTFTIDKVAKDGEDHILSGEISDLISGGSDGEVSPAVAQNYPNPFNPDTWIPFAIDEDCAVNIRIYDITGRLIRTLDLGYLNAGVYIDRAKAAHWDGLNNAGESVASNVYFYTFRAGSYRTTRKMIVAR